VGFTFQSWIVPQRLLASAYPGEPEGLLGLSQLGIGVVVNLHERAHGPAHLASAGLSEVHVPVADFTAPSTEQLATGVQAIRAALANGQGVAVHCAAGLGRTGTLVACYLVSTGLDAAGAIARVRDARPGSVETAAQEAAVEAFARRL
jgi:atypical dual specificity phosphatase